MSIDRLASLAVVAGHALALGWDDGKSATVDLSPVVAARKSLAPLADTVEFAQARLADDGWSVEWPSGIDFGTQQLRRWADEQASKATPPPPSAPESNAPPSPSTTPPMPSACRDVRSPAISRARSRRRRR